MDALSGTVNLTPGQTSITVRFNGAGQPLGGNCNVMRSAAASTNIQGTLDWKMLTSTSATIYFTSAIPNDGTVYKLFYVVYFS